MAKSSDIVLIMGACGVGKSTVAIELATKYNAGFVEADDYHPPENVAAMTQGVPLTDEMRWGWLDAVAAAVIQTREKTGAPVFLACSALKKAHRDRLRRRLGDIAVFHLYAGRKEIDRRVSDRSGHFMSPKLVDSQIADLEPPGREDENAVHIDGELPVTAIVDVIAARIKKGGRAETPSNTGKLTNQEEKP